MGLELVDLIRLGIRDEFPHEVTRGNTFLAENPLLSRTEFIPGYGTGSVDHVVEDMPRDSQMLLHFVELVGIDHGNWILLSIDRLLGKRLIEFGKGNSLNGRAKRFHRGLKLDFMRSPQLQPLHIIGNVDGANAICNVAKSIVPVPKDDKALLFGQRREPLHARSIQVVGQIAARRQRYARLTPK
jgi:hypothetical protein